MGADLAVDQLGAQVSRCRLHWLAQVAMSLSGSLHNPFPKRGPVRLRCRVDARARKQLHVDPRAREGKNSRLGF